jgi:hypothetical protein
LLGPTALAGTIAAVMIAVVGSIVAVFAKRR